MMRCRPFRICCLFINFILSVQCLDFLKQFGPSPNFNNLTVTAQQRLWIYSTLYSSSKCLYSSGEYVFGVSTDSCIVQSPFLHDISSMFDFKLTFKSFKFEGADCRSIRTRIFLDSTCTNEQAVPNYLEDQLKNYILQNGLCLERFPYYSRLVCAPVRNSNLPDINFDGIVARGYNSQESCSNALPATFAAIPSGKCASNIPASFVPSFPNLLTSASSSYYFQCNSSDLAAMENIYSDNEQCTGFGIQHLIPLNMCEEEKVMSVTGDEQPEGEGGEEEVVSMFQERRLEAHLEWDDDDDGIELPDTKGDRVELPDGDLNSSIPVLPMENGYYENSYYTNRSFLSNQTLYENVTTYSSIYYSELNLTRTISVENSTYYGSNGTFPIYPPGHEYISVENSTYYWINVTYPPEYENISMVNNTYYWTNGTYPPEYENNTSNSSLFHHYHHHHHTHHGHEYNAIYYNKYSCLTGYNTVTPSKAPVGVPPQSSTTPTETPTKSSSLSPSSKSPTTASPTTLPTFVPTLLDTSEVPSCSPSKEPLSIKPTQSPSSGPTVIISSANPTTLPSSGPTSAVPSASPTRLPSLAPTTASSFGSVATRTPSVTPSQTPSSVGPSTIPSIVPSTIVPSTQPTSSSPTTTPSALPSSIVPSATPSSIQPSGVPSIAPTSEPTFAPTFESTDSPTAEPTQIPLKAGETRSPIATPTASPLKPSMAPTFQAAPVVTIVAARSMSFDSTTAATLTSNSNGPQKQKLEAALCNTQLQSQGLTSDGASCSVTSITAATSSFFRLTSTPSLSVTFATAVNLVNFPTLSTSSLLASVQNSTKTFSPAQFQSVLTAQAASVGAQPITVTSVSAPTIKNVVAVSPPSFSPVVAPTFSPSQIPTSAKPVLTVAPSFLPSSLSVQSQSSGSSGGGGGSLSVGAIIGIAVGGVVLLLCFVGLVYYYFYRERKPSLSGSAKVYIMNERD